MPKSQENRQSEGGYSILFSKMRDGSRGGNAQSIANLSKKSEPIRRLARAVKPAGKKDYLVTTSS